jgi:hypothetical protein
VENIPLIGSDWTHMSLKDDESGKRISQSCYIINQDSIVIVYSATTMDSLYKFKKRISKRFEK